jgi:copper transport protein
MAIDQQQDIWLTVGGQSNNIVRLSPSSNNLTIFEIPTPSSLPTAVAADGQGNIWFTESIGKDGRLDPVSGNVTEYEPLDNSLKEPNSILLDPTSSNVYISEHDGKAISVLDPVLNLFFEYPIPTPEGLPFGMALDTYGNVWFAQHVIEKIGVLNPKNSEIVEVQVPTVGSFVQWLAPDDQGRIWFAEQRGSSLGNVNIALNPEADISKSPPTTEEAPQVQESRQIEDNLSRRQLVPSFGFGFADILGPLIAGGIVISGLLYSKNVLEIRRITLAVRDLNKAGRISRY